MVTLATNVEADASRIIVAGVILILAIIVLSLGIIWYRRRWLNRSEPTSTIPWTLDDLRNLYDQGDITEQEYRAMRDSIIATYTSKEPSKPETRATQTGNDGIS
ncbi:MAG: SHOCT domain-containing protein [Planctomycetota bacterium]|jgi:hypothetical protein